MENTTNTMNTITQNFGHEGKGPLYYTLEHAGFVMKSDAFLSVIAL